MAENPIMVPVRQIFESIYSLSLITLITFVTQYSSGLKYMKYIAEFLSNRTGDEIMNELMSCL